MIRVVVTGIIIVHTKAFLRLPGLYSGCVQPSGEGQISSFSFIVNDIKNFVYYSITQFRIKNYRLPCHRKNRW